MMNTIQSIFNQFWQSIIKFLPGSPFTYFISKIENIPYLAELNWFIPIGEMIVIIEAWLTAIVAFYAYSAIMRFIRIIK